MAKGDSLAPKAMVGDSDTKCCGNCWGMGLRTEGRTLGLERLAIPPQGSEA